MSAKQDTYEHEASIVRRLMRDGVRVFFTKHARERMLERCIERDDVHRALSNCRVTLVEPNKAEDHWRAEGRDLDGRVIVVTIVVRQVAGEIIAISVWAAE